MKDSPFKNHKNEEELLDDIFGSGKLWKNKYKIKWCEMCETFMISCLNEKCRGSSCNAGGCLLCLADLADFNSAKTQISDYLNEQEKFVYRKIQYLKKYIKESLESGDYEINWQKMESAGNFCKATVKYFPEEMKNVIPYDWGD